MIPRPQRDGRPRKTDMQAAVNPILYLLRTDRPWRYLPRQRRLDGPTTLLADVVQRMLIMPPSTTPRPSTPSGLAFDTPDLPSRGGGSMEKCGWRRVIVYYALGLLLLGSR